MSKRKPLFVIESNESGMWVPLYSVQGPLTRNDCRIATSECSWLRTAKYARPDRSIYLAGDDSVYAVEQWQYGCLKSIKSICISYKLACRIAQNQESFGWVVRLYSRVERQKKSER